MMTSDLDRRIENVERLLEDIIVNRSVEDAAKNSSPWAYTYWLSVFRKLTKQRLDKEYGGPKGPEPTRFGTWENNGREIDF